MTETPNPHIVDADTLTGEMRPIRRAVLSLGANLGERMVGLQGAIDSLQDTPDVWLTGVSPVYETDPVDSPAGSRQYLNAIVLLDTTLSAARLLDRALAIEEAFGRERSGVPNESRTLDVDLIVVGDRRSAEPHLHLPHPRAAERAFVLAPWHDLEPDAVLPDAGPIQDLLEAVGRNGISRRDDLVLQDEVSEPDSPHRPDPDPDQEPSDDSRPSLGPVSAGAMTAFGVAGLVGGWAMHRVGDQILGHAPLVTWSQVVAPYVASAVLGVVAWITWRQVQGRRPLSRSERRGRQPLDFQAAVNRLVLARACALIGCLIAGGYLGYALSWLWIQGDYAVSSAVRSTIAGVGGILMTLTALALQRACRVRSEDDST